MSLKKRFSHTPNSEVFSLSSLSSVRDVINSKPPSLELDIEVQETKGSDTDVTRETSQPCRYRWFRQLAKKCATKYPTPYARMQKVVLYLRGPSPAVDLPGASPNPLYIQNFTYSNLSCQTYRPNTLFRHSFSFWELFFFTSARIARDSNYPLPCKLVDFCFMCRGVHHRSRPPRSGTCIHYTI